MMDWKLVGLAGAVVAIACAPLPNADDSEDSDGGTDTGTKTEDDVGGDSEEVECSDFFDLGTGASVDVVYKNNTESNVFLYVSACTREAFEIQNAEGEYIRWTNYGWSEWCEIIVESNSCGGAGCLAAVLRVDPGGSVKQQWDGGVLARRTLPEHCYAPGGCGPECDQLVPAEAGSYQFEVQWSTAFECYGSETDDCPCDSPMDGGCFLSGLGGAYLMDGQTRRRPFRYPDERLVEFVFE